ncbi:hypothetical protein SEPCBS57363_004030 [Sporothrix epigloea]|uniref:C3H1-type domain-containing protein n=1 Tax=Sporothrix epigloea TaxID=1892477 RepID=A0ABP0DPS5_9PEZI
MSSYGYGPPPPPPFPAQPAVGYGQQYQAPYQHGQSHGGHPHMRGGRGGYFGGGRGGGNPGAGAVADHQSRSSYGGYGSAQQYSRPAQYAQSSNIPSPYGAPSQQPPSQQHWSHDTVAQHHQLPPQGYYPPQGFQQQSPQGHSHTQNQPPYGQQPLYASPSGPAGSPAQPSYGHQYQQQAAGYPHQWNSSGSHQQNGGHNGHYSGREGGGPNVGGGYHHEQRGGAPKAHVMGPPIRIGFENGNTHGLGAGPPAPVSNRGYQPPPPPGPYNVLQGGGSPPPLGPTGYGAVRPYQPYAPAGSPQHYDPNFNNQNNRQYTRGGFHTGNGHRGGRMPHVENKMRYNKKPGFHNNGPLGAHAAHLPSYHQKPDAASAGKKKKRKTNTLGLTPGDESDEEEADEESKLVELIGPDAPNPVDIAAWIAERRSNFPTKERIQARLANSSDVDGKAENVADSIGTPAKPTAPTALERQQQKAEKLRRQLEKVESSIKRKREQQDEGDEMRDVDDAGADSDASLNSDDEAPETEPIHSETSAVAAAASAAAAKGGKSPGGRKADPTKHCKYYSTGGTCGKKGKCRFVHDPAVREAALQERERNGGRITLKQRLVLNDKEQEDLTIIKTLQYLKEKGMMTVASAASTEALPTTDILVDTTVVDPDADAEAVESEMTDVADASAAPSSLLSKPDVNPDGVVSAPTMRYQGWDLSGFGNAGAKVREV